MTTLKRTDGINDYFVAFTRAAGLLVYTIFKMTAWTVGLGALGFAALLYIGDATELVGGTLRVAAGTALVYLVVTQAVKRVLLSALASPERDSGGPQAR